MGGLPGLEQLIPLRVRLCTAVRDLPNVREDVRIHGEVHVRVHSHQ